MQEFFKQLKKRKVIKEATIYVGASFLLIEVLSNILPIYSDNPEWILKIVIFLVVIIFPFYLIFAWMFSFTPEGVKRTSNSSSRKLSEMKLNLTIAIIGLFIFSFFTYNFFKASNLSENPIIIAVLPFNDFSPDNNNEWFCNSITEDILTNLSKISSFNVISRTSVMKYRNSNKTIPEIADELGANYILEGSVRKAGDKVVITAQLIDENDKHIWAENYDEVLDNEDGSTIFKDIPLKIVDNLHLKLSRNEKKSFEKTMTVNLEAYKLFIKGKTYASLRTKANLEKSIELFENAVKLDPKFSDAYSEIALSYLILGESKFTERTFAINIAKLYIDKALGINKNCDSAILVLGVLNMINNNYKKSEDYFEKALELNPESSEIHYYFSILYRLEKDFEKELEYCIKAYDLDPFSLTINTEKVISLILNNQVAEAKNHFQKMKSIVPRLISKKMEGPLQELTEVNITNPLDLPFDSLLKGISGFVGDQKFDKAAEKVPPFVFVFQEWTQTKNESAEMITSSNFIHYDDNDIIQEMINMGLYVDKNVKKEETGTIPIVSDSLRIPGIEDF